MKSEGDVLARWNKARADFTIWRSNVVVISMSFPCRDITEAKAIAGAVYGQMLF